MININFIYQSVGIELVSAIFYIKISVSDQLLESGIGASLSTNNLDTFCWSLARCPYYTGSTVNNFQFSQLVYCITIVLENLPVAST